jgi:hypothetical protein
MVKSGLMDAETAANHPDRNCLISVLMGTRIPKVDCPTKPVELKAGDIVICASDGLQFMTNEEIEWLVRRYSKKRSTEIAERLLEELEKLDDPDQDNISFTVIKVNDASVRPKEARPPRPSMAVARPKRLTTVVVDPQLLPLNTPAPAPLGAPPALVPVASMPRQTSRPAPEHWAQPRAEPEIQPPPRSEPVMPSRRMVTVQDQKQPESQGVEDLNPVRLRPRRVIVIK